MVKIENKEASKGGNLTEKITSSDEHKRSKSEPTSLSNHPLHSGPGISATAEQKNNSVSPETGLTDAELIYLIQQQNEAAYIELAERYAPLIYSLAAAPHCRHIREELIPVLRERLYIAALKFDPARGIPAAGYIAKCLRFEAWNLFKKARNRWQREVVHDPYVPLSPEPAESAEDPADLVCRREEVRQVRRLLTTLTPKQRQVLRGIYFRDLSRQDLADEMNCTPQAVSDLHHRALRNLRENWPLH